MLSRSRSWPCAAFVLLGLSACAPTGDGSSGTGTGGNQSGTSGTGGGGDSAGAAGTSGAAGSGAGGTTGVAGSAAGTAGSSAGASGSTGATGGATGAAGATGGGAAGRGGATAGTGGAAGRGGTGGSAGGRGGTTGTGGAAAGTTGSAGTTGAGGAATLIWPNDTSKANSDPWLSQNHDRILQLQPKVLVIDLENTANAAALVDRHIASLKEATSFHKYKDSAAQPAVVYQLAKIVQAPKSGSAISYTSWNTQAFADSNIQMKDPADPSGPNLTLCQLFQKGVINEVWCMASQDPKCGETQEQKARYDANDVKTTQATVNVSNGDSVAGLNCPVTVRITDFNSGRGTGCHQHAMGHAWERYISASAVPALRKQAARFLNFDLMTRVQAPFNDFYSACSSNGSQLTDCMIWDSQIAVHNGPSAARTFNITDMSGGCGNAHFYANTTGTYSYDANTPDPTVLTSCENYGLHNGTGGKDLTTTYNNAMTDTLYGRSPNPINGACATTATPACSDDCGGHGTTYLYQNFPGPNTKATNDDGTAMRNWWVYLFY